MDIFNQNTYARFESALPQEFSMIFILTSVCMAIRFFQEFAKEQKAPGGGEKRTGQKLPLVSGAVCNWIFSDTDDSFLQYHGCLDCCAIGVAAGFCFAVCADGNTSGGIMVTGILSVLLSVLPMAAGVAMGKDCRDRCTGA